MNELPKDIGGYQNISFGKCEEGDLWVLFGVPSCFAMGEDEIGRDAEFLQAKHHPFNLYRKIPVPSVSIDKEMEGHAASFLPQGDKERKDAPMYRGLLAYFPAALFEVAAHSQESDQKHNPGNTEGPTWARAKSPDHADCIIRHLAETGVRGTPGRRKALRAMAWRALALLQEDCEADGATPGTSSRF